MHLDTIRAQINQFFKSGWADYVLQADGRWFDANDKLRQVRRNNIHEAFYDTYEKAKAHLNMGGNLYRTLLLNDAAEAAKLATGLQDFGLFWTSCMDTAETFQPRRQYQTQHPMPEKGRAFVVKVSTVTQSDVDWIATVGCQLTNPMLSEFRLMPGTLFQADDVYQSPQQSIIFSTPNQKEVAPVPEGPGFIENFRQLAGRAL